jgi:hypothetical protein
MITWVGIYAKNEGSNWADWVDWCLLNQSNQPNQQAVSITAIN